MRNSPPPHTPSRAHAVTQSAHQTNPVHAKPSPTDRPLAQACVWSSRRSSQSKARLLEMAGRLHDLCGADSEAYLDLLRACGGYADDDAEKLFSGSPFGLCLSRANNVACTRLPATACVASRVPSRISLPVLLYSLPF